MDYNEVLRHARERIGPKCKVCPECNGLGCGNTMPGPGSKAPGNGANDNWRAWRRWSLNMDTIAPNTPVDTSLALFGRTFSLPVIAAPIGSLRAQFNPGDDIRDYNACAAAAAAQTGIAASFGDGLDARVFPHGCELSKQYGGIVLPVINPLSMDTIRANLDLANAARPFAVSVVIDSAGLPHLKAASPDAGSKTVAELRELCGYAQMPMILKGIMTVRGAQKAVEAGADVLCSPVKGKVIKMADVPDPVFGGEVLGKGCAVWPEDDLVYAPCDGKVTVTMGHAVGLQSDSGIEVLVHVGVDTVNMNGDGFEGFVKADDVVKAGQPMLKIDRAKIAAAGYKDCVVVAVSNTAEFADVELAVEADSAVAAGDAIVKVVRK